MPSGLPNSAFQPAQRIRDIDRYISLDTDFRTLPTVDVNAALVEKPSFQRIVDNANHRTVDRLYSAEEPVPDPRRKHGMDRMVLAWIRITVRNGREDRISCP